MTTLTVWLLLNIGVSNGPTMLIERFATESECARVANIIRQTQRITVVDPVRCIQTTIVK